MTITLTPQEASARLLSFLHDGRLIQGAWHKESGGRELACMIGALDPSINSAEQCPSSVMPQWLAHCTVELFDRQTKTDAMAWAERYGGLMARWHVLTLDAWARAEICFKLECVRFAISAAEPACKDKDYWPQVTSAAQQVCDALEGRGDLAAAGAAARDAARDAARAAGAAADAAMITARAAARAAGAADGATDASRAAGAAAWAAADAARAAGVIASKLLDAIEREVSAAEDMA